MPLRAVLFDAGNTLVHLDYPQIALAATSLGVRGDARELRTAEYRGREWLDRELLRRWEQAPPARTGWVTRADWQRFWRETAAALIHHPAHQETVAEFLDQAAMAGPYWCAVPADAVPTLAELRRRGLALAVVSNSNGNCQGLLAEMGLADYFDVVVDSALLGAEKPHAEIFSHALEQLQVRAEEALMVGDFYSLDVVGAERAGLRGLLYDPLRGYRVPKVRDTPRIAALSEIPSYLDRQG